MSLPNSNYTVLLKEISNDLSWLIEMWLRIRNGGSSTFSITEVKIVPLIDPEIKLGFDRGSDDFLNEDKE
jgi:hypothetical protein